MIHHYKFKDGGVFRKYGDIGMDIINEHGLINLNIICQKITSSSHVIVNTSFLTVTYYRKNGFKYNDVMFIITNQLFCENNIDFPDNYNYNRQIKMTEEEMNKRMLNIDEFCDKEVNYCLEGEFCGFSYDDENHTIN